MAKTVTGRNGHTVNALPIKKILTSMLLDPMTTKSR